MNITEKFREWSEMNIVDLKSLTFSELNSLYFSINKEIFVRYWLVFLFFILLVIIISKKVSK